MMGLDTTETYRDSRNIPRINCASSWFSFTRLYRHARPTKHKKYSWCLIKVFFVMRILLQKVPIACVLLSQEYLRNADAYNISTVGCRTAGLCSKSPVFNPNQHRHCKNKVAIFTLRQQSDSICQETELHLGRARLESRPRCRFSLWFWRFYSVCRQSP